MGLKMYSAIILKNFSHTIDIYISIQDQATAAKAELAASSDEVRHQTAKTRSLQTQLREKESQLTQTQNELEVSRVHLV